MLTESDVAWQAAENGILQPVVGTRAGKAARPGGHRPRPANSSKHRTGPASATVAADSTAAGAVILDSLDRVRLDAIADASKQPRGGGGARGGGGGNPSRPTPQRSASGGLGEDRDTRQLRATRDSHSGPLAPPRAAGSHSHSGPQPRLSTRDSHSGPQPGPPPPLGRHGDPHVGTTLGLDMKALAQMERAVGLRGGTGGGDGERLSAAEARAAALGRDLRRPPSGGGGRSSHAKVMMWDDASADAMPASGPPAGVPPLPPHMLPTASGAATAAADTTGGHRTSYDNLAPGFGVAEELGRTSRTHSSRMRIAALTADNLAAMEPRRRSDPSERVLRWLDDIDMAETTEPETKRGGKAGGSSAPAARPPPAAAAAAPAVGGSSMQTSVPQRNSTATRPTAPATKPSGFSLASLLPCFGKPNTRS